MQTIFSKNRKHCHRKYFYVCVVQTACRAYSYIVFYSREERDRWTKDKTRLYNINLSMKEGAPTPSEGYDERHQ